MPNTWTGRVVSVRQADLVDRLTNYQMATIAATNQSAAVGGTAPGDLSDSTAGGYFLLEDSSGDLQLEDGSGRYVLEGTTFAYRHLSIQKAQNQDGSVTTHGSLETFETGYAAGQTFKLTSSNFGIAAQTYTITNVTISFVGANPPTPVYLVEFGDAYQTLQKAGGGVLTQQGSQANIQAGVAVPGGVLGYAEVTASQSGITTEVDLTGLSVTVQVATGRRIRVMGQCRWTSTVAGDAGVMRIKETAILNEQVDILPNTTQDPTLYGDVILTPSAGVHTYKLTMLRQAGTGSLTMFASSTNPAHILVEDIGT